MSGEWRIGCVAGTERENPMDVVLSEDQEPRNPLRWCPRTPSQRLGAVHICQAHHHRQGCHVTLLSAGSFAPFHHRNLTDFPSFLGGCCHLSLIKCEAASFFFRHDDRGGPILWNPCNRKDQKYICIRTCNIPRSMDASKDAFPHVPLSSSPR